VHDDEYLIAKMIEEGAHGYITKDCHPDEVHQAIMSAYKSGVYINANTLHAIQGKMAGTVKKPIELEEISPRELDVLRLICKQMTTDEIAEKLFISPKTVNGHRNNLFQKTGSKNMIGLVMYAVKNGLVEVV
jgi:DNA-binding NarL/FixJ family response regulator